MRARFAAIFGASIVLAAALFSGCEDVPGLRFGDGGTPLDAGASDAKPDRAIDGAVDGSTSCPDTVPANAEGCCDTVPCVGQNCASLCLNKNCSACTSTEYCCTKGPGNCITPGVQCE